MRETLGELCLAGAVVVPLLGAAVCAPGGTGAGSGAAGSSGQQRASDGCRRFWHS
ncbi:MAG: hypothetical protein ACYCX8_04020 [Acidimicrobiales bacterium]